MFNLVQPVFNPNGSARPVYDQILPNMAKNGRFWGPPETPGINFDGSKWVELVTPYVRYNPVQPVFHPNRPARPVYGLILSNIAKNGCIGGPPEIPRTIFDGFKGVELVPPYVKYNVQPCLTGVQPK